MEKPARSKGAVVKREHTYCVRVSAFIIHRIILSAYLN